MDHFVLSQEATELLKSIERSHTEQERRDGILNFARSGIQAASRVLMEIYSRCLWRETRFAIIQALGLSADARAVGFLRGIARRHQDDFPLMAEILRALGKSKSGVACEYLWNILKSPGYPLQKEALRALDAFPEYHCQKTLMEIMQDPTSSPSLIQLVVLTLGKRRFLSAKKDLGDLLGRKAEPALQNAVILSLGRIGDSETAEKLKSIDTTHRHFVEEIRQYAADRILLRRYSRPEDAIREVISCQNEQDFSEGILLLREFPDEVQVTAVRELCPHLSPERQGMLRAVLWNPARVKEDTAFILTHHKDLSPDTVAAILRADREAGSGGMLTGLWEKLPSLYMLKLCQHVRCPDLPQRIREVLTKKPADESLWVEGVNALVHQHYMIFADRKAQGETEETLLFSLARARSKKVRDRVIRALGQLAVHQTGLETDLAEHIKKGKPDPSVLFALERIHSRTLEEAMVKRLGEDCSENSSWIIRVLSFYDRLYLAHKLADVSALAGSRKDLNLSFLQILSHHSVKGGVKILENSLRQSSSYQEKILAIAAARFNHNDSIWELLFKLLDHPDASIRGRSLDSICTGGRLAQHIRLFQWFRSGEQLSGVFLKILRSMNPVRSEDYREVVRLTDELLEEGLPLFQDHEVRTAAIGFRDTLETSCCHPEASPQGPADSEKGHLLDKFLLDELPAFSGYPEVIKSVLRNAELTWQYPELFDHLVDKSTMVIEYTKSIDLLLQECIGGKIFNFSDDQVFQTAQSHLMRLDLESLPKADLIRKLQCSARFNPENFPYHKMMLISRSVLNGKIKKDQFRILDGLRSWSVLLLLFARPLTLGGITYPAVLPDCLRGELSVVEIAWQLNYLQEVRNRAAHRGTLFRKDQLEMVRDFSFSLLKSFDWSTP